MLGYISYGDGLKRPVLERLQLQGCPFVGLRLPSGRRPEGALARRRAAAAARALRSMGVRQAVFPMEFPYGSLFLRQGVTPVDPVPLRRALAAGLVQRELSRMGLDGAHGVIAVSGERMERPLMDTVRTLAIRYRYVILDVPSGGEEFARTLRREYGISLLLQPAAEQMERADALLLFSLRGDLRGENPVCYALYPGGEKGWEAVSYGLPAALREQSGSDCCREQLLAALWAAGVLSPEDILAEIDVDRTGKCLYNAKDIIIK